MTAPAKVTRVTELDITTLETIYADGRALAFVIEEQKKRIELLTSDGATKDRKIRLLSHQLDIALRSMWSRRGYEKRLREIMAEVSAESPQPIHGPGLHGPFEKRGTKRDTAPAAQRCTPPHSQSAA